MTKDELRARLVELSREIEPRESPVVRVRLPLAPEPKKKTLKAMLQEALCLKSN